MNTILVFHDQNKGWRLCLTKHKTQTLETPLRIII